MAMPPCENIVKYFKKTLALFQSSVTLTLHFAIRGGVGGYGATDNCSPRWAQE
jgi:hypothetical protein